MNIYGRDRELGLLRSELDAALEGELRLALIVGEAGIGKSRLLNEILQDGVRRGFTVYLGSAGEFDRDLPFGPLSQAFGRTVVQGERVPTLPEVLPPAGPPSTSVGVEQVAGRIEAVCLRQPCIIAIENLQWADDATLTTLIRLRRRLSDLPTALLVVSRPFSRGGLLEGLGRSFQADGALMLTLSPLTGPDVNALASEQLNAPPGTQLEAKLAIAGGNPLFVSELLAALMRDGAIKLVEGKAEAAGAALPQSIGLTLLSRLGGLRGEAMEILRFASILGTSFSFHDLCLVAGKTAVELLPIISEAKAAGILGTTEEFLVFRHELVREAIYEDLPSTVRKQLHREFARELAESDADLSIAAAHFSIAAEPGDEEAAGWMHEAGRRALRSAPETAAAILEPASRITRSFETRDLILTDLIEALAWSGRPKEAESIARELLSRPHFLAVGLRARLALSEALLVQDRPADAIVPLEESAALPKLTRSDRACLDARSAFIHTLRGDFEAGEQLARRALAEADLLQDPASRLTALHSLALLSLNRGQVKIALDYARLALRSSGSAGDQDKRMLVELGYACLHADRIQEAEAIFRTGMRMSASAGAVWYLPLCHIALGSLRFHTGNWEEAVSALQAGTTLAAELDSRRHKALGHLLLAQISLQRGDLDSAELMLADAMQETERSGYGTSTLVNLSRVNGLLSEAKGDLRRAFEDYRRARDICLEKGLSHLRWVAPDLVRASLALGDRQTALETTVFAEDLAVRAELPTIEAAALRCRGRADEDPESALRSVELFRGSPRSIEFAAACEDAAAVLDGLEKSERAAALLQEAHELYLAAGATRDAARAESRLRALGVRRGRRGARGRPRSGWASLTGTEETVTDLVKAGLSNPEIAGRLYISRRTVESHLSNIFGKLQISSRTELAALAAAREGVGRKGD